MRHTSGLGPFPLKTSLAMATVALGLPSSVSCGFKIRKGKSQGKIEKLIVHGQICLRLSATLQS